MTGAEDDKAFVWRIDSGEVLFECSGMTGYCLTLQRIVKGIFEEEIVIY